jgi:copper chaperone NosL
MFAPGLLVPFLFSLVFVAACRQSEPKAVDLLPEDMCAYCKMAISEKRYAAEFITRDGEVFKFDDIGCMVNYTKSKSNRADIAAFFVVDFESKQWLRAETACFVRSPEFKTPMNGNIAAFRDNRTASRHSGEQRTMAEVMAGTE